MVWGFGFLEISDSTAFTSYGLGLRDLGQNGILYISLEQRPGYNILSKQKLPSSLIWKCSVSWGSRFNSDIHPKWKLILFGNCQRGRNLFFKTPRLNERSFQTWENGQDFEIPVESAVQLASSSMSHFSCIIIMFRFSKIDRRTDFSVEWWKYDSRTP